MGLLWSTYGEARGVCYVTYYMETHSGRCLGQHLNAPWMPASPFGVLLLLLIQLPVSTHPGKQQVMVLVLGPAILD